MGRKMILGVGFDPVSMGQALHRLEEFIPSGKPHLVVTANPEMVMLARRDPLLAEILQRADLVVADGIGVVWAGGVLGQEVPERIPGIELAEALLARAAQRGWGVFLLGAQPGVAEQAAAALTARWPELRIVGTQHGFFQGPEEEEVLASLKELRPHILLAALGVPRQEKWLAAHLGQLKIPVAVGVGGSFNVWAGVDQRAPAWLRKLNLEWLYRLVKQPWRIKRMAVLPLFVLAVWQERLTKGR
ncbi:MAG: WecB/TagA/CpsF family glycosyltransferase [Limnochordia bacterium]|nr:WecB/TagA/CpsF family glycosyltransferase [Limnochordia bacterium]MDI9464777.1 WecB/TagA/CpsF family glycosyltransferase [Bacillota bacterium]HOB40336.1 WecB/TagA/CpsF family glycosyltransferase [Limnochordia bacterium]HOK31478.1 WecB/TagA/CpsF family glycosyltransferase [Limnochordia bacterium]HOM00614.1 WecB/TagA/CpsF family glycosyltransferase [Limnochordia bacterium]